MVTIELDKVRHLHFDLRAIKDLEATMNGQPLGAIVGQLSQLGVTAITVALWAGLKHEDRGMTPNLATKLLESYLADKKSLRALGRALSDAIDECGIFNPEDEDEPARGNATTTTGTTTGN